MVWSRGGWHFGCCGDLAISTWANASRRDAIFRNLEIFVFLLLKHPDKPVKTVITILVAEKEMGLHEDACLVNEAAAFAYDTSKWSWWWPQVKLAEYLRLVTGAFYRVKDAYEKLESAEKNAVPAMIEVEQKLAWIVCNYCEDKDNPPFVFADGAYDTRKTSIPALAEMVVDRIKRIVEFRRVLGAKLLEEREENERYKGQLREDLNKMHRCLSEKNEEIAELTKSRDNLDRHLTEKVNQIADLEKLIRIKDEALLAAGERIKGQSEALTAAAGKAMPHRRPCELIHPPYSGKCEHCRPPSPQDLADMNAPEDRSKEVVSDPGDDI